MPNVYHIDVRLFRQQEGANHWKWMVACPLLRLEAKEETIAKCMHKLDVELGYIFGDAEVVVRFT